MVDIRTHLAIDQRLCGKPQRIENGESCVAFTALPEMAADKSGLVHGGFVFGLGDYVAMLAVNHPNVVLGSADVKFLSPVQVGDTLEARASVRKVDGKKQMVEVVIRQGDRTVFTGLFTCFVLEAHVLD
ncbi:hotdog domain-containing protein [Thermodesulfobacteriota bacterium]